MYKVQTMNDQEEIYNRSIHVRNYRIDIQTLFQHFTLCQSVLPLVLYTPQVIRPPALALRNKSIDIKNGVCNVRLHIHGGNFKSGL